MLLEPLCPPVSKLSWQGLNIPHIDSILNALDEISKNLVLDSEFIHCLKLVIKFSPLAPNLLLCSVPHESKIVLEEESVHLMNLFAKLTSSWTRLSRF